MTRRVVLRLIALLVVAALVPACGGGGGGGGGAPPPPAPPPPSGGGLGGEVDDGTGGTAVPGPDGMLTLASQQASAPVRVIMPAPDPSGDMYVGGAFRTYASTLTPGIARLNADGTVDTDFAVGAGFVQHDMTAATGYFTGIPAGFLNLDYVFGVYSMAAAPDGSGDIYVGGRFTLYQGAAATNIVRLNADGSRDTDFMPPTLAIMGMNTSSGVRQIVPASDGSGDIYIIFNTVTATPTPGRILRLTSAGAINPAFVTGTNFTGGAPFELVQLSDGDLIVAGTFSGYNGTAANGVIRLNSNGTVDPVITVSFAWSTASVAPLMPMVAIAVPMDGSGDIYVGGSFNTVANRLVRLNSNGSLDITFATGAGFNGRVTSLAMDPGGDLWVGGDFTTYNGGVANRIVRLNPDGSVDSESPTTGFSGTVYDLKPATDSSGDIYACGAFSSFQSGAASTVCRINSNGTLDNGFQCVSGLDFQDFLIGGGVWAVTPAVDGSGDVYVGGAFTSYAGVPANGLVRLNPNGSRDMSFATGAGLAGAGGVIVYAIVARADGDVFVAGQFTSYNGASLNGGLIRLNANGSLDTSFSLPQNFGAVRTIAPVGAGTGDLYVARAAANTTTPLVRMNSIGVGYPGFVVTCNGFPANGILAIGPAPSGEVYIGGTFFNVNGETTGRVIRLDADGARDPAFVVGTTAGQWPEEVRSILPATDGSGDVYIGCATNALPVRWGNVQVGAVFRVNANGSLDTGFSVGTGLNGDVWGLAFGPGGSVYVCGQDFLNYNGVAALNFMRLNADGTRDAAFPAGGAGFSRPVQAMSIAPGTSGDVLLGGTFRYYGTTTASGVLAINPDGTVD